ncbi:MAG: helix-turn-helix domain-containing protein [Ginsengibacter sp.]
MDNFAKNIKYLRTKHGLNQSEAAQIVTLTRTAWSEYEHGWSKPRFADLLTIADYFDVSLSELVEIDLRNVNLNDILELRKIIKKVNPNVKLSVNPKYLQESESMMVNEPENKIKSPEMKRLEQMEEELKKMRRKLGG